MAPGRKTGGRVAGTPNKASASVRASITKIIDSYFASDTFAKDIAELEPRDRVMAMERLASYVAPKLQATTLDMTIDTNKTIEDTLIKLSGEDDEST